MPSRMTWATWMPFGPSSRRHRLRQSAQGKFWGRKGCEAGSAAERSGRAGEDDRAASVIQHGCRRGPADQEARKAARPPGLLEQLLGNIEDAALIPDADIEDDQGWRSEVLRHAFKNACDLRSDCRIAGIATHQIVMPLVCTAFPRHCGDEHALLPRNARRAHCPIPVPHRRRRPLQSCSCRPSRLQSALRPWTSRSGRSRARRRRPVSRSRRWNRLR